MTRASKGVDVVRVYGAVQPQRFTIPNNTAQGHTRPRVCIISIIKLNYPVLGAQVD
jgi:hypothetical protein